MCTKILGFIAMAAMCAAAQPCAAQSGYCASQSSATGTEAKPVPRSSRAISVKWRQHKEVLGRRVPRDFCVKRGRAAQYEQGFIFWRPEHGAFAVFGAIARKWRELGREAVVGVPISDEAQAPNGGRFNDFDGERSIYWSPDTDAHLVSGSIRREWLANGGAAGGLGYPVSDDYAIETGRRSDFQYGYVVWSSETHTTVAVMQERCVLCADGSAQCGTEELCAGS